MRQVLRIKQIDFDLSDWDVGDWPLEIGKCLSLRASGTKVVIKLDEEAMEKACRKIAKEAVEAFFSPEDFFTRLGDDGLSLWCATKGEDNIVLPFENMDLVFSRKGRDAMIAKLQAMTWDDTDGIESNAGPLFTDG